ncbi:MAG: YbaB/EbfC family nucleoid-associated protein [candidate division Zixibacteria bacterium]|nr:YbaB/EbfC family nucleoid-associated protein [candidate division Zixibacteria bacterium]
MAKGFGNMMKQVQKMQARMAEVQEQLAEERVEGTAGGGMVKAVANGRQELVEIVIDKEVVDPDDVEMLQDLIVAAVNQAQKAASDLASEKMDEITGGLNIPGLSGLM